MLYFFVYYMCLFLGSDAEKRWSRIEGTGTFLYKLPASKLFLVCFFFTVWVTAVLVFVFLTALVQHLGNCGQVRMGLRSREMVQYSQHFRC